jgi:hypothetical protein
LQWIDSKANVLGTDVGWICWVDLMGRMAKMKPEPRKASGK